ncbi:MAG: curli assembly protein CsgF, partial [Paracoccaceae bacterium]|nr:curli assembly protein CsgF [Paracoccaceae bacterium]
MTTIRDTEEQGRPLRRIAARLLLTCSLLALGQGAMAQDLVYTPINPSFGGSPLNSSHLLSIANAQRTATARDAETN